MARALLETKLHVPRQRRDLVRRPDLGHRLDGALSSPLTLVSAPAGFGKTTLLTQWLAGTASPRAAIAWLSLDARDNDPALFLAYLVTAMQKAAPGVGATALSLLESPGTSTEAILVTVINDLATVDGDVVVVLDDYHVIDARDVQESLAFLVENLPSHVHLVVSSRSDPALPLARLRARGELVEIRAADLRFTAEEAAAYLNDVMNLALTPQDVASLERRTEGWIAALQLAALSLRGRDDSTAFIAGFAGDDRYVVDYLAEEVLQRQPDDVRDFLLHTSILSRMTGPLCDAVTGQDGGSAMLAALERANLFVVPLDDRRQWYRYHHLFADVLRARLLDEQPARVAELHRLASDWHARNGDRAEAVRHALAGGDFNRAADVVELAVPELRRTRQEATLRRWLEALPNELIQVRPVLSVAYAGALLIYGELDGAEERLRDAEAHLEGAGRQGRASAGSPPVTVVVDRAALPALPSSIALYRAAQARIRGDVASTMAHARRAIDLAPDDDHLARGAAAGLLGLAYWTLGDLEAAHRWYTEASVRLEQAGHLSDVLGCTIAVADICTAQGRLHEAMRTYQRSLTLAAAHSPLRGEADMHVGMAQILREHNDIDAARAHLNTSRDLGEHAALPQNRYRWRLVMGRLRQIDGDPGGALQLLDEAEQLYISDYFPDVRPIPAVRARVLLAQGRLDEAVRWAHDRELSADDELSYLREFEHLTLARILLARGVLGEDCWNETTGLLRRLLDAAERGGRAGSVTEILALQALTEQARGDGQAAIALLRRAVTLAEPEGYVRTFLDEGMPMTSLLQLLAKQDDAPGHLRRLLSATGSGGPRVSASQGLVDPLSARELEVLRMLGSDMDGPEIARQLVVSLNTVRTHTKNIYAKLGVNNRRAAVRRSNDLGLLSRDQ